MILIDGITGFSNDKVIYTAVNKYEFKRICFQISNILKFKIEDFDFKLNGKSFYFAKIKFSSDTIFILINAYYPIITFASEISPFSNKYINSVGLNIEFSRFYRVLSISELECSIDNEELKCLNLEELKQLKHYKPNNLAEVNFNNWD